MKEVTGGKMLKAIEKISLAIETKSYDDINIFLSGGDIEWNKKSRQNLEKIIRSFQKNKISKILACIILYTFFEGDEGITFARERGVFAYYMDWDGTERILGWLVDHRDLLNISEQAESYLIKKYDVCWLDKYYKKCDQEIDSIIEEHEKKKRLFKINGATIESCIVMELLAILELLFRLSKEQRKSNKAATVEISRVLDYDLPDYYSLEELSEAVSYVISRYRNLKKDNKIVWLDADAVNNSVELADLILIAAKRKLVSEWEIDIDYYGYGIECAKYEEEGSSLYRIIDEYNLEKSKQLGLIKTEFQEQARSVGHFNSSKGCVYLYTIANNIRKYLGILFKLVDKDTEVERYIMTFPTLFLEIFTPKDFNKPEFFGEEIAQIEDIAHEMFISTDELLNYKITDICAVKDVILFKRFFTFVSYAQQVFIEEHYEDKETIIKSIVPSFQRQNLIQLLEMFVGDKEKADDLLKLYCWDGSGYFDIQSTPIIRMSDYQYLLVPYVLATSNLIRNVIVKERKNASQKTNSNGEKEPLEIYAKKIFDCQQEIFSHKEGRKFKYNGQSGEVDLVVWSKNHLYLIECKNSILPTSPFELRTTYDYIKKAEMQLDLSSAALRESSSKKQILNNWGVPLRDYEIHTLILLGNRIYTAPNGFRHQIRYIHELFMLFSCGVINSSFGKWRYWQDEIFSEEDFIRFISENDPLSNDFLDAMSPFKLVLSCGEYKIERESYSLDIVKHWKLDDDNLVNQSEEIHMQMRAEHEKQHEEAINEIMRIL